MADTGDAHLLLRSYAVTHPRRLEVQARQYADWDQLAFAARGVITVETTTGTWTVPPHRAVWVPARVPFTLRTSGRVTLRTLFLRPSLTRRQLPRHCVALNVTPLVRELILEAARRNTLRRAVAADRRLVRLLVDHLAGLDQEPLQCPLPRDPRALRAAHLIAEDGASPLRHVARLVGASARTLERLFLRETAMTLGRWRRRARLTQALRLLADGNDVTSAAMAVGYQTPSAFIVAFRRELGTTPGQYFHEGTR